MQLGSGKSVKWVSRFPVNKRKLALVFWSCNGPVWILTTAERCICKEAARDNQPFEGKDDILLKDLPAHSSVSATGISDYLICSKDCCFFPTMRLKRQFQQMPMKTPPGGRSCPWEWRSWGGQGSSQPPLPLLTRRPPFLLGHHWYHSP